MALGPAQKKLEELEARYEDLGRLMLDPEVLADIHRYQQVHKAWSDLTEVVEAYRAYRHAEHGLAEAEALLDDAEMRELALADVERIRPERQSLEERLTRLLLPRDPNDDKNVIMEIRPAAGGEEAALFAGDLMRLYLRYAERRGWKVEVLNAQETGIGGYSDVALSVQGRGAYSQLKFESGVHRVQRVPATESSGRIHTSTATVAVLPEAEEVEVDINPNDLAIDVYHSSSAGGQNVQKVATAIRMTHKPTGIVVTCQDERSQLQNREKAMRMLRARIYEREMQAQTLARTEARRSQVGSGDRSEKIRTYNLPDGRVTDHRTGVTIYNMSAILDGDIQAFIDSLLMADQAERLRGGTD
ncbi:MAG TPA: peptide chain release factor 1 [Chthonomonadales bacterium]|nr:peptide chain release factor 1 [Chthonomonadales bacterium]